MLIKALIHKFSIFQLVLTKWSSEDVFVLSTVFCNYNCSHKLFIRKDKSCVLILNPQMNFKSHESNFWELVFFIPSIIHKRVFLHNFNLMNCMNLYS
jgi:hypothetical protein